MASTAAASSLPDFTVEKLHGLKQLQITLHDPAPARGADAAFAPSAGPLCAINNSYPFKPVLQVKWAGALLSIPLSARVALDDAQQRTRMTQMRDGVVISMHMKQDLSEPESDDAFPTAREISPAEYASVYCRSCGCSLFPPSRAPTKVFSLPSPFWNELSELWFCHTADNAHVATLAQKDISVRRGAILLDKLVLRVHGEDLAHPDAWRKHSSVRKLLESASTAAAVSSTAAASVAAASIAAASAAALSVASAEASPSRDVWSPLPCAGCSAILGSILLTVSPCSDPLAAVRLAASGEVRLHKHQLSNCFRRREMNDAASKMDVDSECKAGPAAPASAPASSSSACLCSSYSPASAALNLSLTCSNMFLPYTLENRLAEDLAQRYARSPVNRFIVEAAEEHIEGEEKTAEGREGAPIIRLLVTHWDLSLSSTLTGAFPFTPAARTSNAMRPVLRVEFALHRSEEEEGISRWIHGSAAGKKRNVGIKPSEAAANAPPHVERVNYSAADVRALAALLQARSGVWPPSAQAGMLDSTLRKSCLLKLSAHVVDK